MADLAVSTAVFDRQGWILLVHQTYGSRWWALPGGWVEPGEDLADAARRECYEETGYEVQVSRLAGVYWRLNRQLLVLVFLGYITGGCRRPSPETDCCEFFPLDRLPSPLSPCLEERLHDAWEVRMGASARYRLQSSGPQQPPGMPPQ
ncbi:MAG TPA: NUDIX domain-containing protein [Firmicutes bacterium]|nr:NUDIX domain-containing protein [Bacillota bacterium]